MRLVDRLDKLEPGTYRVEIQWDGGYHLLGQEGYSFIHDLAAQVVGLWKYKDENMDTYTLHVVIEGSTSTEDMKEAVARYVNNDKLWRWILKYEGREGTSVPYLAIVVE